MSRRDWHRRGLAALLLVLTLAALPVRAQTAAVLAETRELLELLGLSALLEQAPATLGASLDAEAKFRRADAQQVAQWRARLAPALQPRPLQDKLARYVAERYQQQSFRHARDRLQEALPKRVRFFELATAQPAAVRGLRAYRVQLEKEPQPARRALVQALDSAAGTSMLLAVLQTGISENVRRAAGAAATTPELLQEELKERQRYLAPFTEDYLLYAYRYLNDDELVAYRELLGDEQLQWLLDVCRQGLIAALENPR